MVAMKVVIIVSGGNVQGCFADRSGVEIEMLDFDNIADDGDVSLRQAEARAEAVVQDMQQVY
jgi:hypothetical protein